MCGRFTLTADPESIRKAFALAGVDSATLEQWQPRYNVAPSQAIAAIIENADGIRQLELLKWGLIPSWAKDPKIGYQMINARGETVAEKSSYRVALKKRRCLIPADGFYEWKKENTKKKTPMYIQLQSGEPFAFAGLYESWRASESEPWVKTCTIITTEPNSLMESIHDRMPVILKPQDYETWLSPKEVATVELLSLLKPYPASEMKAAQVSTLVNSPSNDSPECIQPV